MLLMGSSELDSPIEILTMVMADKGLLKLPHQPVQRRPDLQSSRTMWTGPRALLSSDYSEVAPWVVGVFLLQSRELAFPPLAARTGGSPKRRTQGQVLYENQLAGFSGSEQIRPH